MGLISLACFVPGPIPSPWVDADIGTPGQAGSATYDPSTSTWVVTGGGGDIWGTGDQFNYAYMPVTGDAIITAHVANLTDSTGGSTEDQWSKAGVMFRDGTAAGAMYAFECFTGNNGTDFQFRSATAGSAANNGQTGGGSPHHWVRVTRTVNAFQGAWSDDGVTWTNHGAAQTITMPTTVNVGLAVTAHNNATLSIGTFDNVIVTDGTGNYLWPEPPPTNLAATAGFNQASLSWTAAPQATSYTVLRGTAHLGPYGTTVASGLTTTSFIDTGITFPNTYYYVVVAIGPIGTSPYSNEASCSPLQPNIVVSPTSLQVAENGGQATFTVTPRVPPGDVLTINLASSNAGAILLTGNQASISLTWAKGSTTPLQVTVIGVDQHLETGPISASVNFTSVTCPLDPTNYPSSYVPPPIPVDIIPDSPAIVVNPPSGLSTTNGGPAIQFTVQLATIPSGNVYLNLSVSDPNLATVAPTTFTIAPGAWNTAVPVTVTPLNANPQTTYIAPYDIFIDSSSVMTLDPLYRALPTTIVPISTPISTPPLSKVWSSGCGLSGAEVLLPLGLLALWRRRRRKA
jgi:hypothetical protein